MDELFGVPVSSIAIVLGIVFVSIVILIGYIFLRNAVLVRMAFRNVKRRPGQSILIISGLMLATAIISSSFTMGDSITFSIKRSTTESLRSMDQILRVDKDSDAWMGKPVPEHFSESLITDLLPVLEADPDIDGILPILEADVVVINNRSRQFEVNALFTGIDSQKSNIYEPLYDLDGMPIDLLSLASDEVYIDRDGAVELGVEVGDVLGIVLGPGEFQQMSVRAIVDGWYYKRSNTEVVLMINLLQAQSLLGLEGQLSSVLISNKGDSFSGEALSSRIVKRYEDMPAIKDKGLEVYPVKSKAIEFANTIGSLFVSFFTTFGLFSIGVGLLLIFLIFSMLAAERRSEMGMARAVGMQRRHLVRMFTVEGAIYGLGSILVGSAAGVGIGFILVNLVGNIFMSGSGGDFTLSPHVEFRSLATAFFMGAILTFVTVMFASYRTSKLNIVRAIRDIPEPQLARAGRKSLIAGIVVTVLGLGILFVGFITSQFTSFGLGISLVPIGLSLLLRWKGVGQRWVLTGTGIVLLVFWLLPASALNMIRDDWSQDFSGFFVSGALLVTGAVLVTVNNSKIILGLMDRTLGRIPRFAPIIKSAVSYPLRYGFRTGLSLAMFAVVIFSVTVMSILLEGFGQMFDDQQRLGGGYDIFAFSQSDLNPVSNLKGVLESTPELDFIRSDNGDPVIGTFRTIRQADARLSGNVDASFKDTSLTGVDDDFISSNRYSFELATSYYMNPSGVDNDGVWRALRDNPGLAVVNAALIPTRNNFGFGGDSENFMIRTEGLFIENVSMDPISVDVRDIRSGISIELVVIGVLDSFASNEGFGPLPGGIYTSTRTLDQHLPRALDPTMFFFGVEPETLDAAKKIEAAFFQNALQTLDIKQTIEDTQSSQRSFFNLLIAFMTLGLVVGIVGLGVISARAVVERWHSIGVLRAIGFSRAMVMTTFLAESSFIALLGIGIGLILGLVTSINVIGEIRADEPAIRLIFPWTRIAIIVAGTYLFSLIATVVPARQASQIEPAEALRYE
jgi:putative ABC transport system permease protein